MKVLMPVDDDTKRSMLAQAGEWIAEGWFENAQCMVLLHASVLDVNGTEPSWHPRGWSAAPTPAAADESDFINGSAIFAGDGWKCGNKYRSKRGEEP
ncbi:hypothetical protein [Paraburkholderia sp. HP33-1]|uniref:hypothetical protein n=1 Tax=Paraburkholderia sp. HP33-1 TaxID=2883243 RepID=UPI001F39FDD2|nr:hypothetical protein [Paraburkholderia sp. HP33-1]